MVVELLYVTTVRERYRQGDPSEEVTVKRGSALKMNLTLDEYSAALDLTQVSPLALPPGLRKKDTPEPDEEPPQHLIEVATQLELWETPEEQDFWHTWSMYPDPSNLRPWAFDSVRALVSSRLVVLFSGKTLSRGSVLELSLPTEHNDNVPLMSLEVVELVSTTFLDEASPHEEIVQQLAVGLPPNVTALPSRPRAVLSPLR